MHTAENNDVIIAHLSLLSQGKAVAYKVRELLNFVTLIIMAENYGLL